VPKKSSLTSALKAGELTSSERLAPQQARAPPSEPAIKRTASSAAVQGLGLAAANLADEIGICFEIGICSEMDVCSDGLFVRCAELPIAEMGGVQSGAASGTYCLRVAVSAYGRHGTHIVESDRMRTA